MSDVFFWIFEVVFCLFVSSIALYISLLSSACASSWILERTRRFFSREEKEVF